MKMTIMAIDMPCRVVTGQVEFSPNSAVAIIQASAPR